MKSSNVCDSPRAISAVLERLLGSSTFFESQLCWSSCYLCFPGGLLSESLPLLAEQLRGWMSPEKKTLTAFSEVGVLWSVFGLPTIHPFPLPEPRLSESNAPQGQYFSACCFTRFLLLVSYHLFVCYLPIISLKLNRRKIPLLHLSFQTCTDLGRSGQVMVIAKDICYIPGFYHRGRAGHREG